jgi:hypothetical protein
MSLKLAFLLMISLLSSLGSLEKQKPPSVPNQSEVLNLESADGAKAADSLTPTIHSEGSFCCFFCSKNTMTS